MPKRISAVSCCLQVKFSLESLSTVKLPHLSRALSMIFSTFVGSTTFRWPQVFFFLFLFSLFVTKLFSFRCHIGENYKQRQRLLYPYSTSNLIFRSLNTYSFFLSIFHYSCVPSNICVAFCFLLLTLIR